MKHQFIDMFKTFDLFHNRTEETFLCKVWVIIWLWVKPGPPLPCSVSKATDTHRSGM